MIQSSRANGVVRGSISGLLYLEDLDEDVIPEVGDVVVTSGLGGSYERGLIIGAVVSVNKTASDSTGDVIVEPNGNASILEEVIVVFSAPDVEAAEKAKAEAEEAKAAQEAARAQEEEAQYQEAMGEGYDGSYYTDGGAVVDATTESAANEGGAW